MIRVPERGPWKDLGKGRQERDLRRYRLRHGWLGGLRLQLQVERRSWDVELGLWRHRFAWRRARPADMPAVFSMIVELPSRRGAGE